MRMMRAELMITAAFTAVALGQPAAPADVDRVFHFSNSGTVQDIQEMGTTIRSIAEIRHASLDPDLRDFTVHGTAEQITLAQWLFNELEKSADRPAPPQPGRHSASPEFRLASGDDHVVRVFYVPNAATARDLQEVATMIRSIGEVRRVFTCNTPRAITLRGTDEQLALAEWLLTDLDTHGQAAAASESPASREFRLSGADDTVRVYYATHTATVQDFQEVATLVRSIAEIRRVFTCNTPRVIALRGTGEQLALADWLFHELKQPVDGQPPDTPEYHLAGGGDDTVRVFYLTNTITSPQQFQDIVRSIRTETKIRRAFTYNAPRAVAFRGTAAQIATAEQLLKEQTAAQH